MGSTEEATKTKSMSKKKLNFNSDEEDKSENSEEHSVGDDLKKASDAAATHEPMERKKVTPSVDIQGAVARSRNDSESSSNGKSPTSDRMKRQRTVSEGSPVQSFLFPGIASSPPKFMSLEEVMKAAKGVSNMVLAHEIAVDKNFKLEKFEPPENSLERRVRDTMHKAFWDNLSEQLAQDPPSYDQAFVLLQEVRDNLIEITLPHHTRLRQEITDKFDVELIKQQVEHGVLNFEDYSQYVLSVMARLCAPVRDEGIQALMRKNDVVTVFRGVMETLDLMRLDMANYTIQQIRPHIIAQSVDYEKKKFAEFLKTQNDGLEITRGWLTRHINSEDLEVTDDMALKNVVSRVISRSYLYLLSWPDDKLLPETVVLDGSRVLELKDRLTQICIMGATILVTLSSLGQTLTNPDPLKIKIKRNLCSILDPALSEKETYELIENIAEQVIKDVSDYLSETGKSPLPASAISALKSQLLEIKNPDQRIRQLITTRAHEFIGTLLVSTTARPVQVPPGLSAFQEELAHIFGALLRLVSHNRAVFGEYYADIILDHVKAYQRTKRKERDPLEDSPTGSDTKSEEHESGSRDLDLD